MNIHLATLKPKIFSNWACLLKWTRLLFMRKHVSHSLVCMLNITSAKIDFCQCTCSWTMELWWGLFKKVSQMIGQFGQMGRINCGVSGVIPADLVILCPYLLHYFSLINHYFYKNISFWFILKEYIPYGGHYNPWFVYFLPHFWRTKMFIWGAFFVKFWPYKGLVFKSGL